MNPNHATADRLKELLPDRDRLVGVRYYLSVDGARNTEVQAHVGALAPVSLGVTRPDEAAERAAAELVRQLRSAADRIESRLETMRFA